LVDLAGDGALALVSGKRAIGMEGQMAARIVGRGFGDR
jgi:hypothetical protein